MPAIKARKFSGWKRGRPMSTDWEAVFRSLKPGMFVAIHTDNPSRYLSRVSSIAIGARAVTGRNFVGCINGDGHVGIRED